MSRKWKIVKRE